MRISTWTATAAVSLVALAAVSPAGASEHRLDARPLCRGLPATIVGTPGPDFIGGTPGDDVIVGLGGDDGIRGRAGNDIICGGRGTDRIRGGAGDDTILDRDRTYSLEGGTGDDIIRHPRGNLASLFGGAGDDILIGPGNPEFPLLVRLDGGRGDDRLRLRGPGVLAFEHAGHPIRVDLRAGTASGQGHDRIRLGPHDGGDIVGIPPGSEVRGTPYGDTMSANGSLLIGRGGDDQFNGNSRAYGGRGNDGFDSFVSRGGHNHLPRLYGNRGQDTFRLATPMFGGIVVDGGAGAHDKTYFSVEREIQDQETFDSLKVDLDAGLVRADATSFPLRSIEAADVFLADVDIARSYEIDGSDGPDSIEFAATTPFQSVPPPVVVRTRRGDDAVVTTGGDDTVYGGAGNDSANTEGGSDTCVSVENPTNCEILAP